MKNNDLITIDQDIKYEWKQSLTNKTNESSKINFVNNSYFNEKEVSSVKYRNNYPNKYYYTFVYEDVIIVFTKDDEYDFEAEEENDEDLQILKSSKELIVLLTWSKFLLLNQISEKVVRITTQIIVP